MDSLNRFSLSKFASNKNETFGLKCRLCLLKRSKFYCQSCVKHGDFTDSTKLHCPERFAEKEIKLIVCLRNKQSFNIEEKLKERLQIDDLKQRIIQKKEKIKLLKWGIQEKRNDCKKQSLKLEKLRSKTERTKLRNGRSKRNIISKKFNLRVLAEKLEKRKSLLGNILLELSNEMSTEVQLLVKFIFKVEEVKKSDYASARINEPCSTVSQLDDATRTAYINGNWVQVTSEESLRVVESELPASGDYSAYHNWIATYGTSGGTLEFGFNNCAHRISSALTYTSQLLSILSFIFNVKLPHKMCYSEFCSDDTTDSQFIYKVAKLNANVMYLCLAQGMDSELVHPRQTLLNLCLLFNQKYCQYRETKDLCQESSMVDVMEEQLVAELNSQDTDDESDDDRSSFQTDNLDISPDWETVPQNITCDDISSLSDREVAPASDQGFTGSIVSSAAASVVSFLRGYAGQK